LTGRELFEHRGQLGLGFLRVAGAPVSPLPAGFFQVLIQFVDGLCQILQALIEPTEVVETALTFLQHLLLAAYPFEQLVKVHRFLVVVRKAFAQRPNDVLLFGTAGQHDRLEHALIAVDLL